MVLDCPLRPKACPSEGLYRTVFGDHLSDQIEVFTVSYSWGDVGFDGLLSSLGGFVMYQDTYPMYHACIPHVSRMYPACILMCPVHIYIKIHQDTSRYICILTLAIIGNVSYLGICILL